MIKRTNSVIPDPKPKTIMQGKNGNNITKAASPQHIENKPEIINRPNIQRAIINNISNPRAILCIISKFNVNT